ncbi:MFS transporter [Erwinia sp. OLTSP20]|uniref:MFS transporter n=1 Tax=unclassified Erwinia TaxID=2622719 RepID=UPI000C19005D|nr:MULTISPECIES: MFS transporter [unclassified Erwinia]PIJ50150.1 MFS transporter [Erwinia sp. OAMSP11]PIJ71916.1 MFS transporter [Erwinia sp. OLSSP12]PIJ81118.1 MFS transporter [Erwinia sp. OLCASP19]PIJ83548.1 MFS transporter [Erwinia sp. OLMTSP26]PIJ86163.1 MFS transporter [Erwinia sp. OLMDSP33]
MNQIATPADSEKVDKKQLSSVAFASLIGTFIEFYDYFIYGAAAALVFPHLFFTELTPTVATIVSFATLGVAFVTRPIGAIIFGHYGDTVGRKAMLIASVSIMGIATVVIGLLPTYETIGLAAPILLIIIRLIQGLAVGGEWGGATTMMIEYAPKNKRGFYGTFVQLGNVLGVLCATGSFALASALPEAIFLDWGWRIPFLASIILMLIGIFIRMKIQEPPLFKKMLAEREKTSLPIVQVFKKFPRQIFLAAGLRISESVVGYLIISYVLQYTTSKFNMPSSAVLTGVMVAAASGLITFPLWGMLSDKIGRRAVFLIGAFGSCLLAYPFYWLVESGTLWGVYLALILGYSFVIGSMYSIEPCYLSEMFSTEVRYTGVSVGSQLAGVFGGFTPMVATALVAWAGGGFWPITWMIIISGAVTGFCALATGETMHRDLNDDMLGSAAKSSNNEAILAKSR